MSAPSDPPDPGISLGAVLSAFSAPITEEHAWAVVHQSLVALEALSASDRRGRGHITLVLSPNQLLLTQDGLVHPSSFLGGEENMVSLAAGIAEIGVVVYSALDYSLAQDLSRNLTAALENLIDVMTSADQQENSSETDEGIGSDSEAEKGVLQEVLNLCRHHLAVPGDAVQHYRAVVRALVAEARELSQFIRVLKDHQRLEGELQELDRGDWAGLWTNVMDQLRRGVKLKKVDYSRTPAEFELTPYEMLMDDIRVRNYKLRTPVADLSQSAQKDAREVILEFIRSRPPLKPASERKLTSVEHQKTPVEMLMNDIRGSRARQSLRRTNTNSVNRSPRISLDFENDSVSSRKKPLSRTEDGSVKKFIDPDTSFTQNVLNFEESPDNSQDDLLDTPRDSPEPETKPVSKSKTKPFENNNIPTLALEEVFEEESSSNEHSRSGSPVPEPPKSKFSDLIGTFNTLDLNLEEVSHIRCTFTKVELEDKEYAKELRKDYEKGRICFLCGKVRFNLFNWAYPCQFCRRLVCSKCCTKIRLPSDKLRDIPVCSLSSQLDSNNQTANHSLNSPVKGSTMSVRAPISNSGGPFNRSWDRHSLKLSSNSRPQNLEVPPTGKPRLTRAKSMDKADVALIKSLKLSGERIGKSHDVCHDCKELLTSLIRAQRHAAKLKTMKSRFSRKSDIGVFNNRGVAEMIWPEGEFY